MEKDIDEAVEEEEVKCRLVFNHGWGNLQRASWDAAVGKTKVPKIENVSRGKRENLNTPKALFGKSKHTEGSFWSTFCITCTG